MRSEQYDATERVLMADPVIQDMAREVGADPAMDEFSLFGWDFIRRALEEYRRRGGDHTTHIGGPAAAIRRIIERSRAHEE